jgi:hypothetical protein
LTIDVGQGLLNAILYMGPLAIIGGMICMFMWERTARNKIKVVLVKTAGGTDTYFVNKEGNEITLSNKATGWVATWPISELATIPQPYPDLAGLLPRFLQREIRVAIYIEGDIEPLLNRSRHRIKVMSPDVYSSLTDIVDTLRESSPEMADKVAELLNGASTGPTRELIASPDWIGALRKSTALKALASVSDDLMEALKQIRNQLSRFAGLNATVIYIGLALIIVLQGIALYFIVQSGSLEMADLTQKMDAIYNSLGIKP